MRRIAFLCALLSLHACAHSPRVEEPVPTPTPAPPPPAWVTAGSGAFTDAKGLHVILGVGRAEGTLQAELRTRTAEAMARAEVAKILNTFVNDMMKQYGETCTDCDYPGQRERAREEQELGRRLKELITKPLPRLQIVNHWVSPAGTFEYALASFDLGQLCADLLADDAFSPRQSEIIRSRFDSTFRDLVEDAEERRR